MRTRPVLRVRAPTTGKKGKKAAVAVALLTTILTMWLATAGQRLSAGPINIGWDEYESALAKWNSLHVTEYEQDFRDLFCRYRLTIHVERGSGTPIETVTHSERLGSVQSASGYQASCTASPGRATEYTVSGMFLLLREILEHPSEYATNPFHEFKQYWTVDFHPAMGYPTSIGVFTDFDHDTFLPSSRSRSCVRIVTRELC